MNAADRARRAENSVALPLRLLGNVVGRFVRRQLIRTAALVFAIIFATVSGARAQTSDETETKLKAAFILKFTLYVEWPSSAFTSPTNPIVFGVVGRDPFGKVLDATMQGQTVDKHPVVVKRGRTFSELSDCHVIFVSASERDRLRAQLPRLQDKPILTISDIEGFVSDGGMIEMKRKQGTLRFDINRHIAEAGGLKISSRLLKLADEVR